MASVTAASGTADMGRRIKAIFIGSIGNLVEWYDFYAYAAFQIYFANSFFPSCALSVRPRSSPRRCTSSRSRLSAEKATVRVYGVPIAGGRMTQHIGLTL